MFILRREAGWEALAPAKVNLYLELRGRRSDGYHELETLMVPVAIYDSVRFVPLSSPSEQADSPGEIVLMLRAPGGRHAASDHVPADEHNLAVRALKLLQSRSGTTRGARLHLTKRIPSRAGLGGASSDAAAALLLANRGWNLGWDTGRLAELAAELGSDVPFFVADGAAVCGSRGERVESIARLPPLHMVVVRPPYGLSTGEVYAEADRISAASASPPSGGTQRLIDILRRGTRAGLAGALFNGLQTAAASLAPRMGRLVAEFARMDFLGHQLTGSGSAYFGICRNARHATWLAARLRGRSAGLVLATCSLPSLG